MKEKKITELRKGMATDLLDNFINGMDNLGFTKEEILPILHSSLEKKRKGSKTNDRVIKKLKICGKDIT